MLNINRLKSKYETNMKKAKIIFWVSTTIIFLFEGVLVALTSQSEIAKQGISHLGYPLYFGTMLAIFKVLGTLALIIPQTPPKVKEWAYAGFGIDFISALVSTWVVDGFGPGIILPFVFILILIVSYLSNENIKDSGISHKKA